MPITTIVVGALQRESGRVRIEHLPPRGMAPATSSRMDLQRRVAAITGAWGGLGRAVALDLARRGGIVVLAARRLYDGSLVLPETRPRVARGTTPPREHAGAPATIFSRLAGRALRLVVKYQLALGVAAVGFAARTLAKHDAHHDPRIRIVARATRWMLQRRELAARSA